MNNEVKRRLLFSSKKEFLEKGYHQASLRTICKNADVTTGALYFFFKDKEDVFASLVEEPLNKIKEEIKNHYQKELLDGGDFDYLDDLVVAEKIVRLMYEYYDEMQLLLCKSQGSRFENVIDDFVAITEKQYRQLFKNTINNDMMFHWLAHMHVDVFVFMITHERDVEKAVNSILPIMQYLFKGSVSD